jgi:hypothetical protein
MGCPWPVGRGTCMQWVGGVRRRRSALSSHVRCGVDRGVWTGQPGTRRPPLSSVETCLSARAHACCHAVRASASTADRRASPHRCVHVSDRRTCLRVYEYSVRACLLGALHSAQCRMSRGGPEQNSEQSILGRGRHGNKTLHGNQTKVRVPCLSVSPSESRPACSRPHDFVLPRERKRVQHRPRHSESHHCRCRPGRRETCYYYCYYSGRRGGQARARTGRQTDRWSSRRLMIVVFTGSSGSWKTREPGSLPWHDAQSCVHRTRSDGLDRRLGISQKFSHH